MSFTQSLSAGVQRAWQDMWPLKYQTSRVVTFRDNRIGALDIILQLAIVIYVLYDIIVFERYVYYTSAKGTINTFTHLSNQREGQQETFDYCENPADYVFTLPDQFVPYYSGWSFNNVSCKDAADAEIMFTRYNEFSVMTLESIEPPNCTSADCRVNSFTKAPENLQFFVNHAVVTTAGAGKESIRAQNPYTKLYDKQGKLYKEFAAGGGPFDLSMTEWMDVAGVSLDELNMQTCYIPGPCPPTGYTMEELSPYKRWSGLNVIVNLDYRNYEGKPDTIECEMTVHAQEGLWGYTGSDWEYSVEYGEYVRIDRSYLRILFQFDGELGTFDYFTMFLSIVSGVVLMGAAKGTVEFIAMNFLDAPRRKAFKKLKFEEVGHNFLFWWRNKEVGSTLAGEAPGDKAPIELTEIGLTKPKSVYID